MRTPEKLTKITGTNRVSTAGQCARGLTFESPFKLTPQCSKRGTTVPIAQKEDVRRRAGMHISPESKASTLPREPRDLRPVPPLQGEG